MRLGSYERDRIPALMAAVDWVVVPSIWWENAPLVIQEALQHRRPLIVSGIGGMAEMVKDGVTGLHAQPGDASDLARVMRRAIDEPSLKQKFADAIPAHPGIDRCASEHMALFSNTAAREIA